MQVMAGQFLILVFYIKMKIEQEKNNKNGKSRDKYCLTECLNCHMIIDNI